MRKLRKVLLLTFGSGALLTLGEGLVTGLRLQKMAERRGQNPNLAEAAAHRELVGARS